MRLPAAPSVGLRGLLPPQSKHARETLEIEPPPRRPPALAAGRVSADCRPCALSLPPPLHLSFRQARMVRSASRTRESSV
jgi:hypothetical protein